MAADGVVDDAVNDGVGGFPEPAVPSAAEVLREPARRRKVFGWIVGRRNDVMRESECRERHAAAVGDALVHGKEVGRYEEIGVGEGGVHARDHLGNVGFGADIDFTKLVDGRADFLKAAHPVTKVSLLPVGAEREKFNTGRFNVGLIMWHSRKADVVTSFLKSDSECDNGINISGGAVRGEDDTHVVNMLLMGFDRVTRAGLCNVSVSLKC